MRRNLVSGLVLMLAAATAFPCSIAVEAHVMDEKERAVDTTAPSRPSVQLAGLKRGHGPVRGEDGSVGVSSCDELGIVRLHLSQPGTDDRSAPARMGYRVVWVSGDLPEDMDLSPTVRAAEGDLTLVWIDQATDIQEPIDFQVAVVAVDLAGNESAPSETVRIQHPGSR